MTSDALVLQENAEAGDVIAQYNLGERYRNLFLPRGIYPPETDMLVNAYRENVFLRALEYSSSDVDSPFFVQELLWDAKSGDPD